MDNTMMDLKCYSQQGTTRESNRDFIGLFEFDNGVLIYLLDVSTSSSLNCASFIEHLNGFIAERITHESLTDSKVFLDVFQQIIVDLQLIFKSGVASLITSFISFQSKNVWGYTVGDSRIGILDGNISWISPVHTGANPFGEVFTEAMKLLPERHILTRSLNMRKKYKPVFFQFDVTEGQSLVIASDGFWAELTAELQFNLLARQQVKTEDDSTVIFIRNYIGAVNFDYSASSENCSYFDLTIKG